MMPNQSTGREGSAVLAGCCLSFIRWFHNEVPVPFPIYSLSAKNRFPKLMMKAVSFYKSLPIEDPENFVDVIVESRL